MNIFKCGCALLAGIILAMLITQNDLGKGVELFGILSILLSGGIAMLYALEPKLERLALLERSYVKLWNKKGGTL
jgi:hypothetical protein|tara:strand:- start:1559 stop:1783 length:225 start_codon:yes stop_codon:yes gene_type:complete